MTKEELKQEAEEYADKYGKSNFDIWDTARFAYYQDAEPKEKRIEELEQENKVLTQNLEDTEIVNKALEKENAELKHTIATLRQEKDNVSMHAKAMEVVAKTRSDQLTKAKELLERLLITSCNSDVLNLLPNCSEVLRVRVEAEQFLKDETETEQEEPY